MKVLIDEVYAAQKRLRLEAKVTKTEGGCWLHPTKPNSAGYCNDNWRSKQELAHRVSYRAFHGEIPPGMQVRHVVCSNRRCIAPTHIDVGTQSDNEADKKSHGTDAYNHGSGRYNSKLTEASVQAIRLRAKTETHTALAKEFGVARPNIGRIVRRAIWSHVP